jgi:hypothetical protein
MTHKEDTKLNPWWITGFVDAEGCFSSLRASIRADQKTS